MRPLEIRAWDKKEKKMLHQTWYSASLGKQTSLEYMGEDGLGYQYEFQDAFCMDSLEVMLFTGLLDKNGKKIFEGDIVKYLGEDRLGASSGDIVEVEMAEYHIEPFDGSKSDGHTDSEQWEVIGNKYENPELLNNKK